MEASCQSQNADRMAASLTTLIVTMAMQSTNSVDSAASARSTCTSNDASDAASVHCATLNSTFSQSLLRSRSATSRAHAHTSTTLRPEPNSTSGARMPSIRLRAPIWFLPW